MSVSCTGLVMMAFQSLRDPQLFTIYIFLKFFCFFNSSSLTLNSPQSAGTAPLHFAVEFLEGAVYIQWLNASLFTIILFPALQPICFLSSQ